MIDSYLVLGLVLGIVTSFYGTSVGGAGLLVVPMLIFFGLPPHQAVATATFGYWGMNIVGIYKFHGAGKIDFKIGLIAAAIIAFGAAVGSFVLIQIPTETLSRLIGFFILLVLVILLLPRKEFGTQKTNVSKMRKIIGYSLFFPLGVYSAVFGGGGAILGTYILVFFFRSTFLESAGTRKIAFFARTLILTLIYGYHGLIHWPLGIALVLGNGIGAYIGTSHALKKGDQWVRWLFVAVTIVSAVSLLV